MCAMRGPVIGGWLRSRAAPSSSRARDTASFGLGAAVTVVAAAYGVVGSSYRPFTTGADLATAIGFVPVAALSAVRASRADPPARRGPRLDRHAIRRLAPWLVVLAIVAAWELAMYAAGIGGHRGGFPTISSIYGRVAARPVRGLFLFAWQMLGWALVASYRRRPPGAAPDEWRSMDPPPTTAPSTGPSTGPGAGPRTGAHPCTSPHPRDHTDQ